MAEIVTFEGEELDKLLEWLGDLGEYGHTYRLDFWVDDGLKIKVNGGTWTPPRGRLIVRR
jgi:hypothetical protein